MADGFWFKALGHGIKAAGYAMFAEEDDEGKAPARRKAAAKKKVSRTTGKQACCAAKRVPRVRTTGED